MKQDGSTRQSLIDLPDYAALKKLAAALWQEDHAFHGASVMIGAGFSRCGASTGDVRSKLPLWNDLSRVLAQQLNTSSNTDPLRLAEEYCAYFGRQALYDLIKREVNDAAWAPAELHKSLLELPWTEVLTTNWDTLLERASRDVHQPVYSVVSKQEDLSSVRSPRIVKLHGTINVTKDLVFTHEDYRTYPQQYAAFVNFARQVFIENELCLLGFSGDDPNFLGWSGWVRDHLQTHSRRIYLAGALHLTAAKRKYLESINVAPIDIGALVEDYDDHDAKHAKATKIILQALLDLKPKQAWEWSPRDLTRHTITLEEHERVHQESEHAAALLEKHLPVLREDRESYPEWLVCPSMQRWQLQNQISDPYPNVRNLAAMAKDSRAKLLYEIAWRQGVTLQATPIWMVKELLSVCDLSKPCILTKKQQLEIALLLLKNTRWFDDSESIAIELKAIETLEGGEKYWPESANELLFHKAIVARDTFQYARLEELAERLSETDPVWKLRKASLLSEIGRFEYGERLVAEAHSELLRQYRSDPNSIYVLSRLAWAQWILRGIDFMKPGSVYKNFPSRYQDVKCSPWTHVEHLQEQIAEAMQKQQTKHGIEPLFEPGSYKDNSRALRFTSTLHPLLLLDGISNAGGMPLRWNHVSFLVEPAAKVAALEDIDDAHRYSLAIRAADSDTSEPLKRTFSRLAVACMPSSHVEALVAQCCGAIDYWLSKAASGNAGVRDRAIERLRVFCEVLARVSVRVSPEEAKRLFRLAMSLGKHDVFTHVWLLDSLNNLIRHTLDSVPPLEQSELLLDALLFPLQREVGKRGHREWPNPVVKNVGIRFRSASLDRRIGEIIDVVAPCSSESIQSLLRLLPMLESEFLTESERLKLSEAIWAGFPMEQGLPETGLLKFVLTLLPAPDPCAVRSSVRRFLFHAEGDQLFDTTRLLDITNAASARNVKEFPTESEADNYFTRLVAWRPKQDEGLAASFVGQRETEVGRLIGEALSLSVVPAMSAASLTEENFQRLSAFYSEVACEEAVVAFVYFAAKHEGFGPRVEKIVRQQLQDKKGNSAACASHAILKWRELSDATVVGRLASRLISQIGASHFGGLSALIWSANKLFNRGHLSRDEAATLLETVPVVFDRADYKSVVPTSREAVSVSLVRSACARFAADAIAKGEDTEGELARVLEEAKLDALPEVRFATHSLDD